MSAIGALSLLHLRLLLRFSMHSGRPIYNVRTMGRPLWIAIALVFVGWLAFRHAAAWVSSNPTAHLIIFVLFKPVLLLAGSAAVLLIFFYAFTTMIGALTDQNALRLLLLSPVRPALIIAERLLFTSLSFSALLCISLPALFAVGSGVSVTAAYYPAVILALILTPLAPVSLAALITVLLLRAVPASHARTVSAFVGTGLALAFYLLSQVVTSSHSGTFPTLPAWVPSTWPARFIVDVGLGQSAAAGRDLVATAILGVGMFVIATGVVGRRLSTGSASYREVGRRPATPAFFPDAAISLPTAPPGAAQTVRAPVLRQLFLKDLLTLRRDPQYLVVYIYPLFIIGFQAYRLIGSERLHMGAPLAITLVLLVAAAGLMVFTSAPGVINRERKAIVLLALAPISPSRVLAEKWIFAMAPILVLVEAALVAFSLALGTALGEVVIQVLAIALLIVALSAVALMATFVWPKLDATNPRRQASGIAAIVDLLATATLGAFTAILLILGLVVWHNLEADLAIAAVFAGLLAVNIASVLIAPRLLDDLLHKAVTLPS
ncbi:MAG: putative ABC transporter permease subunit [Chloroflexota bacterium]